MALPCRRLPTLHQGKALRSVCAEYLPARRDRHRLARALRVEFLGEGKSRAESDAASAFPASRLLGFRQRDARTSQLDRYPASKYLDQASAQDFLRARARNRLRSAQAVRSPEVRAPKHPWTVRSTGQRLRLIFFACGRCALTTVRRLPVT